MNLEINPEVLDTMKKVSSFTKEDAEKMFGSSNVKEGFYKCIYCGKTHVPLSELQVLDTGIVKATNYICPECRKEFERMGVCPIVCIKCKNVVGYMSFGKTKSGFIMERGKPYHIEHCPQCTVMKDGESVEPIEFKQFKKINNIDEKEI